MDNKYVDQEASIFHFDIWYPVTDPKTLKQSIDAMILEAGFTIINFTEHYFPVQGYTCIWLLAESHLAIHTFPQSQKSYIQLSSCNLVKKEKFEALIKAHKS